MPFILVNNLKLYYRLRRSRRAKRLQLQYHYEGFEVVAPPRILNQTIIFFLFENRRWMHRVSKNNEGNNWDTQNKTLHIYKDNKLLFRGEYIWVSYLEEEAILQWLHQEAERLVQGVIDDVCPKLGKWPQKVRLKEQKTRWGSCGIKDAIQINWRLIFAPAGILEYVVIHELCHLLHRNHGIRFWNKVAEFCPDHHSARGWLRKNGDQLLRMSFRSSIESL
jgi:predicted metal-dependent hydrolase